MGGRLGHRPGLDGLRGVAIALVVASHFSIGPVRTGGAGVTLFLVLSGYLITRLLLEERSDTSTIGLRAFYGRRARRLLPVLVAVLPFYALIGAAQGSEWVLGLVASATYSTNYFVPGHGLVPFGATWSLAIEEHFYLVWPVVVLVAGHRVLKVAVAGAVLCVLLRTALVLTGTGYVEVYHWTHTRADGLLVGCVLAILAHRARPWQPTLPLVVASWTVIVAYSTVIGSDRDLALWGITASVLACAVVLAHGAESPSRWLTSRPLVHLGKISYSLYLWHFVLSDSWGPGPVPLALSVVLAELSWRVIEPRFRRVTQPSAQLQTGEELAAARATAG